MHSELRAASAPTKSYLFFCFSRLPRGPLTSNSARTRALSILGNAGDGTSDEILRGRPRDLANIMYTHIKHSHNSHTPTHTHTCAGDPVTWPTVVANPPVHLVGGCVLFLFLFLFLFYFPNHPRAPCVCLCVYICVYVYINRHIYKPLTYIS
jgi:hypothetical protein